MNRELRGLYAVTPEGDPRLVEETAAALRGGARMVQYRDKSGDTDRRTDEARQLRALCDAAGALFLVNDDVQLARDARADGVHLGRDDASIAEARCVLGADAVIGASCYDSPERAAEAVDAGADYIAFGSFFPSPTKPDAVAAPLELLSRSRERFGIPVCAIGGITPANGRALVGAGADMLAVLSGLYSGTDIEASARAYAELFT